MYTIDQFTLVENIKELTEEEHIDRGDDIYVDTIGMFIDAKKVVYPHVFRRSNPLGPHYAPQYNPCGNDEMLRVIESRIDNVHKTIRYYNEVLNACVKENN